MDTETLNAVLAISNLLIAAIVPFLSVFAAQRLVERIQNFS
jgi:hypothetical protein